MRKAVGSSRIDDCLFTLVQVASVALLRLSCCVGKENVKPRVRLLPASPAPTTNSSSRSAMKLNSSYTETMSQSAKINAILLAIIFS